MYEINAIYQPKNQFNAKLNKIKLDNSLKQAEILLNTLTYTVPTD